MSRYLDPTSDGLFKQIFKEPERLKEFLNSILNLPEGYQITEIEYIPLEQLPPILLGKRSSFDLRVIDKSGSRYIIEMQKKHECDYLKRLQYYSAHAYTGQLKQGELHASLLPVVVVSLVTTTIFDDDVPCISFHRILETRTNKQYLLDLSYVFIELKKYNKNQITSVADEWLHLFKCATEEDQPPGEITSKQVLEAYRVIDQYKMTPEEYDFYIRTKLREDADTIALEKSYADGEAKGKAEGEAKGRAEGKAESEVRSRVEKIEIARNLKKAGVTIEIISHSTGLTKEEIEKLK